MRKRILFLLFICCHLYVNAQFTLKGMIIDENKEGISYSTIQLTLKDSTFVKGEVADSLGNFLLKDIQNGDYLLRVSAMGYETHIEAMNINSDKTLSPLTLKKSEVVLNDVVVTGTSFIRQKDRVLILPDKQQVKHAYSGYDLLYNLMIPGIDVDKRKGTVSSFKGTVSLYIDGKKADYREVQNLQPKDIEKVEYFDMPTGQYMGETEVINYITKKKETGGYVAVDGTQNIGYLKGDYNAVVKVNHKNTSYSFFGGYSMEKYSDKASKQEIFHFQDGDINRNTKTQDAQTKDNQQYFQAIINNSTDKRTLNGKVSLVHTDAPDNYSMNQVQYVTDANGTTSTNRTDTKSWMPSIELYGYFKLDAKQALSAMLKGNYTNNEYDRSYIEDTYRSFTHADEDFYTIDFNGNYNLNLNHNNSTGIQLRHIHQISNSDYTGDYVAQNHLWTGETLLKGQYNQQFGQKFSMSLQAGADFLQYKTRGSDYNYYITPWIYVMANYRITDKQSLMFMFNKANSNPVSSWLSAVDQNIDSLQIQRGNPDLEKANYYVAFMTYNLQVSKFNIQVAGSYFGAAPTVSYDYYIEGNKLINSYQSDANYHNAQANLSVTYRVNDNLRLRASGYYQYTKMTGKFAGDQSNVGGSIDVNYFWKDFAFNVYGKSPSKSVSMYPSYTKTPASYGASISWSHKNWNIEAGTNNTFNKHLENVEYLNTNVYQFHNTVLNKSNQANGYVKVAYTFDFGKKTSRDQKNIDTNINSAILKAS